MEARPLSEFYHEDADVFTEMHQVSERSEVYIASQFLLLFVSHFTQIL